jgi:transposase
METVKDWKRWVPADDVPTAEYRRLVALHMRNSGMKYRQIGEVIGVSSNRAMQLVKRAQRECSAGFRYRYREAALDAHEVQELLPLIDFLREIADGTTDTN